MKKRFIITILAGLFIIPAFSQNPPQDKNWQVVFVDDFNTFNTSRWYKEHNAVHGEYVYRNPKKRNEEPQVAIQENVYIENGKIVVRTREQSYPCPRGNNILTCQYGGTHSYTSGIFLSQLRYRYGYFEIYAKLPGSDGYWPSFWLWHDCGAAGEPNACWKNEIDIFEVSGDIANTVESNAHWAFACPVDEKPNAISLGATPHACNFASGYHWYGLEWDRDKITWYVDRKAVRQLKNDMEGFGIQHYLQIIIGVGLRPASSDNPISPNSIFPDYMYVDQASVYCLNCADKNVVVNEISNFNTFNYAVKKSISMSSATTIPAGSDIYLRATDFIELKAGFEVPVGRELYLDVNPCQ